MLKVDTGLLFHASRNIDVGLGARLLVLEGAPIPGLTLSVSGNFDTHR